MRLLTALSITVWVALLLACTSGKTRATKRADHTEAAAPHDATPVDPTPPAVPPSQPAEPAKLSQAERDRRTESWRSDLEDRAADLSRKGDALEAKLAERAALHKRWAADGLYSRTLSDEVERLKKDTAHAWESLAKVEDEIASGPPESLFALNPPPPPPRPENPAPSTKPPAKVATAAPEQGPGKGAAIVYFPTPLRTVHVSGYTRKDGTRVAPYTRSSPKR